MNNKKISLLFALPLFCLLLSACTTDYAYGPNAPKEKQEQMWGGVGKSVPVLVKPKN
jgi:outer membrane biogenesis lipoprotein LolB